MVFDGCLLQLLPSFFTYGLQVPISHMILEINIIILVILDIYYSILFNNHFLSEIDTTLIPGPASIENHFGAEFKQTATYINAEEVRVAATGPLPHVVAGLAIAM